MVVLDSGESVRSIVGIGRGGDPKTFLVTSGTEDGDDLRGGVECKIDDCKLASGEY